MCLNFTIEMTKLFVWDFHGVLEKGNERAVLETSNLILEREGYSERFSEEEIDNLYGKKWRDYFRQLLPGKDEKTYIDLENACGDFGLSNPDHILNHISATEYSHEILDKILREGHDQILISNVRDGGLELFMNAVSIEYYFPPGKAFASNGKIRRNKKQILQEYIENSGVEYEKIVSIGDSPTDIELVEDYSNGVSFLYSHFGKGFRDCNPTYKIKDLRCVLREVISHDQN